MNRKQIADLLLILLNPPVFFALFYLWTFLVLVTAAGLSSLAALILTGLSGILFVVLSILLAALTIKTPRLWLISLPIQLLLIALITVLERGAFDRAFLVGSSAVQILLSVILYAAEAFVIQAIGRWVRGSYLRRKEKK